MLVAKIEQFSETFSLEIANLLWQTQKQWHLERNKLMQTTTYPNDMTTQTFDDWKSLVNSSVYKMVEHMFKILQY